MKRIESEQKVKDNFLLYSFDIFDTLITRKVATPKGIFSLMQQHLEENQDFSQDFRENFYDIRIDSERYAREYSKSQGGSNEISFDDIYNQMQKTYFLSDESVKFLKELEINTEIENFIGIEQNINQIKDLINNGKRVVLISDMYYSSETLHKLLATVNSIFDKITIYVSSEYKTSKSEGTLYKIIQKNEKVSFKKWKHVGDNFNSDVKMAKHFGITTCFFDNSFMPYERELMSAYSSNPDIQFMVGASKLTRLNKQKQNQDKYDFGASYTAPILYNYVTDIVETAISKGFKTLYFIARDGYVPKVVADIIIQERNLPIKTKYIYGSRLAWRIPDEENYEYFIQMNLKEYRYKISLEFLAYRFGIPVENLLEYLPIKSKSAVLNNKQLAKIKNHLLYNHALKTLILNSYNEQRELLINYLKQEIDFSERLIAFVEVNGSGKTQLFLSHYLNKILPCSTYTFYITASPDNVKNIVQQHVFCTKPRTYNTALELTCRTIYGQTVGYKQEGEKTVPVLDEFNATALLEWGYNEYLQGIKDFSHNVLKYHQNLYNKELFYYYFDYICEKCDKNTAAILGDIPFLLVGKENKIKKAAQKLSFFDYISHYIFRKPYNEISQYPKLSFARGNFVMNCIKTLSEKFVHSFDYINELKLLYLLKTLKNQRVALWGASIFLEKFVKRWNISYENIIAVIDKNPNRIGETVGLYPILLPNSIYSTRPDFIIMTIKNNHKRAYEDVGRMIRYHFSLTKMAPNFFNVPLLSLLRKKSGAKDLTNAELNQKLCEMENNLNRLIQTNISTANLHQKTFLPFKNKHNNQEIVIVASGPTAELYKPIENAIHIGVNRSYQIGNYRIPMDYVFIHDYSGSTPDYIEDLNNYRPDKCQKFYGLMTEWCDSPLRTLPESHAIKANALRYRTDWVPTDAFRFEFAYDISTQPIGNFGSVTFAALQFALWTNPKRIYLVGCDCSLAGYAYNSTEKNFLVPEHLIPTYVDFKNFAEKYYPDIEIVSINPMGLKGIFKDIYT